MDAAGVVDQTGPDTDTDVTVGDRVMAVVVPNGSLGASAEPVVVPAERGTARRFHRSGRPERRPLGDAARSRRSRRARRRRRTDRRVPLRPSARQARPDSAAGGGRRITPRVARSCPF
ncbi:hypothetical protein RI060_37800 [Streptomyces janthinus]|uniref:Uncharacterized protein n=2 Tax=Streptomyces violaceus TaxID=1936 RepID=A0ABY9UIR9_STRVL|nr:hypothetical protein [Streptomyces janthinus]WND22760.1 hypothetical protein RI060_37800 [Streptomyces janthinus]